MIFFAELIKPNDSYVVLICFPELIKPNERNEKAALKSFYIKNPIRSFGVIHGKFSC